MPEVPSRMGTGWRLQRYSAIRRPSKPIGGARGSPNRCSMEGELVVQGEDNAGRGTPLQAVAVTAADHADILLTVNRPCRERRADLHADVEGPQQLERIRIQDQD